MICPTSPMAEQDQHPKPLVKENQKALLPAGKGAFFSGSKNR